MALESITSLAKDNPFKGDNNALLLRGLFFEMDQSGEKAIYTLKKDDHTWNEKTYKSLYRLYMAHDDPTEYTFALSCLDGWEHWQALCNCLWFKPYHEAWQKELQTRLMSTALSAIRSEGQTNASKNAFAANKYLLERGWMTKEDLKRGRPSKQAVREQAEELFLAEKETLSDLERIKN